MINGLPSLAEIESTTVDHLTGLADELTAQAERIKRCFTQAHDLMGTVPWQGQAYNAAYSRSDADQVIATGLAEQRIEAAAIARRGAENLLLAKAAALGGVAEGRAAGFEVRQDLVVNAHTPDRSWEDAVRLQPQANEITAKIRAQAASMVYIDRDTTSKLATATAGFGTLKFTEAPVTTAGKNGVQLVDHTWKQAPPPGSPSEPDPVGKLGLPNYNPGSLSESETRTVYAQGELRMRDLNDQLTRQGVSAEERAKVMFEQRNALRSWSRDLMKNRTLADQLNRTDPNLTFDDLVAKNAAKGIKSDEIYQKIIESATRSRPSVNKSLGIDPEHPPPLPPIFDSAPYSGVAGADGGAGAAGLPASGNPAPIMSPPPAQPSILDHPAAAPAMPPLEHPAPVTLPPTTSELPLLPPGAGAMPPEGFDLLPPELTQVPIATEPPTGPPITLHTPTISAPTPEQLKQAGEVGGTTLGLGAVLALLATLLSPT